jgi:L-lysine exporter family protein LysE/ArgO
MNAAVTTGFALGASMIIAIGAQNAFVLRQGLRREHIAAIVVFCIVADVLLISAGVAGLAEVLRNAPILATVLTLGGVLFLSWYGVSALRRAARSNALHAAAGSPPMSLRVALAQAAGVTLLNPHVYLDTVLLLGSIGARQPPDLRMWFVGGAALASSTWFTALGFGARLLAPFFERPRAWRILDIIVGLTMLSLAAVLATQISR